MRLTTDDALVWHHPRMLKLLNPSPTLTSREVSSSLRMMTWEGVASGALFSVGSGGFMAAYALALGANNLQVGILAALPFITQLARLPAILAVERFRMRKAFEVPALLASQILWVPIGAVPFLIDTPGAPAVALVIVLMAVRGVISSLWTTAWTSWMRDLVPRESMGSYYGGRLTAITAATAVVGLAASFFVQWWEGSSSPGDAIYAYSFLLIGGALTLGLIGPSLSLRAKEPLMPAVQETSRSAIAILVEPLRDPNFSHLVRFLFIWSLVSNLALPFFAVYMLTELGLSLPAVIGFTVLSQGTSILFTRVWGRMVDQVGSKSVLSLSASLYLLVILGWVFTAYPERHALTLPLLTALHIFAGVAAAGVNLATSIIAMRVAPEGNATPYVGIAGIAASLGAGVGPIAGGLMADFFSVRSLVVDVSWAYPDGLLKLSALALTGFDFLFVIAFIAGLFSLNFLVALKEEGEIHRDLALSQLMARADPALRAVSSVPGLGAASTLSYDYLKRVPGADVALGVTAYQIAASSQAAVKSVGRGRELAADVATAVGGVLEQTIDELEGIADHGVGLARHATRGAIHAGDDLAEHADTVVHGAVLGTLRAMAGQNVAPMDALRGAGYGVVEGAVESGEDPAKAVNLAMRAAREIADEMGMDSEYSAATLAEGALLAAEASGEETANAVKRAMPGSFGEPGRGKPLEDGQGAEE